MMNSLAPNKSLSELFCPDIQKYVNRAKSILNTNDSPTAIAN